MLTNEQSRALAALADTLVPATDEIPGAQNTDVTAYLARELAGDLAHFQSLYRDGLSHLDAESVVRTGVPFADNPIDKRANLLHYIEEGYTQTAWSVRGRRFVSVLAEHCAEAYYTHPDVWDNIGFRDATLPAKV